MRTRAGSIGAKARFSRVSVSYSFTSTGISPTCWPGVLLVSNFEKRRPQPARELANNLPANAADDEKAVHGGRYASGGPFRQVFPGASLRAADLGRHDLAARSPRNVPKRADFGPVTR